MSKTKNGTVVEVEIDKIENQDSLNITALDFMAGVAFLGYATHRFEDIYIPEGSTLGKEVSRESYAWAKAMLEAKNNA